MNENESPIHSINVGLGTSGAVVPAGEKNGQHPWVVLICSDLGCTTTTAQRIGAATLNEFLSTNQVIISGNVTTDLPEDIEPFHIEYRVTDVKDFSRAAMAEKLPLLQQLKDASGILDAVSRKKITAAEGFRQVTSMNLPQSIIRLLGDIRPQSGGALVAPPPGAPVAAAKVDSILSMMDVGGDDAVSAPVASQPGDFVAAFSEQAAGDVSSSALLKCKDAVDRLVATLGETVARQPFFRAAESSWNAVKTLLKIAGRNRDVHIFVHSAPYDAAQRHFSDAMSACASSSGVPDLVVWDYPATIDTATMQQLEHIGNQADRYKTVVVVPLDYHDELYRKIIDREPLKQVIEQPACIPLRRLQESGAARCLALCAPDGAVVRSLSGREIAVAASYLLAMQWLSSVIELGMPFHLQNSSQQVLDSFAFPRLSSEVVFDAHRCGITLLRPGSTTVPRVLLGDAETPYGSMLFNMVVNRTARLAAEWIGAQDRSVSAQQAAPALEEFLRTELEPYHILSTSGAVSVTTVEQQCLQVTIDSSETVAGFPVQFQFSFNYRE
ncbi:MAG: hypothetical protein JW863_15840 [Chitinispirillaceae bacterium]|nr:hypothetical protein [Chitinispirillaceae bacterium]